MTSPYRGKFHVEWYAKNDSEAFTFGDLVYVDNSASGTGYLLSATSSSASVIGTILKDVASTDSDYASNTKVPVLVGNTDAEWEFNAASGGATTEIGQFVDLSTDLLLDLGTAYTYGVVQVTQIISTTKVIGKICKKNGPDVTTA
ncbi:MAG: hypothetical protein ACTSRU_08630 [Candidatus Hodarchaeales archaeon]